MSAKQQHVPPLAYPAAAACTADTLRLPPVCSCTAASSSATNDASDDWRTLVHDASHCATYGICGHRADGDPLSCANNTAAQPLAGGAAAKLQAVCPQLAADTQGGAYCCTEEQLDQLQKQARGGWGGQAVLAAGGAKDSGPHDALLHASSSSMPPLPPPACPLQIQVASIFLVGCPACAHNFKHLFCLLTCAPGQAAFANVTAVQAAADTGAANAVAELEYYVSGGWLGGCLGWMGGQGCCGGGGGSCVCSRDGRGQQRCAPHPSPPTHSGPRCPLATRSAASFSGRLYDSCKDVVYPVMNQPAMKFVGG